MDTQCILRLLCCTLLSLAGNLKMHFSHLIARSWARTLPPSTPSRLKSRSPTHSPMPFISLEKLNWFKERPGAKTDERVVTLSFALIIAFPANFFVLMRILGYMLRSREWERKRESFWLMLDLPWEQRWQNKKGANLVWLPASVPTSKLKVNSAAA